MLCVGLLVDATSDGGEPLQGIVSKAQCVAYGGLVGSQQTGGLTVSVGFRIIGATQLPVLCRQLIVGVIGLTGGYDIARGVLNSTGHQTSLGIIAVLVGQAGLAVLYRIELSITGVGIVQHTASGVGSRFHAAQVVIGKGYALTVTVSLALENTVVAAVGV